MDDATSAVIKFSLTVAALLVTIAPLLGVVAMMKLIKGVSDRFGVPLPGQKFGGRMKEKAGDFRKRSEGQRAIRALNSDRKFRPGFGKYRREARLDAKTRGIESEKSRASQQYVAGQMKNADGSPTRFAKQVAGGSIFGAPDEGALQRALAGAKFTIDKAEAEEVQAHHATVENMDEASLNAIVKNTDGSNSDAKVAAALERLVTVGSTASIAEAVDQYGSSGKNDIINKTLANSLAKDGPGFLKKSDIDNIGRGQLGQAVNDPVTGQPKLDASGNVVRVPPSMAKIAEANVEAGVYSPDKLVGATSDELNYAYGKANAEGKANLERRANELLDNPTLSGKIKHNEKTIRGIAGRPLPPTP